MSTVPGPSTALSAEQLDRARRARALTNSALLDLDRAKKCAIECRAEDAAANLLAQKLDLLIQHFGTQRANR